MDNAFQTNHAFMIVKLVIIALMDNVYQMIHQSINARLFDVVVDIFAKMEFVFKILAPSQHAH